MAYVTITKDLTEVKDKVAFGLTRRQIICFSLGGLLGAGGYFLTRHALVKIRKLKQEKTLWNYAYFNIFSQLQGNKALFVRRNLSIFLSPLSRYR